MVTIPVRVRYKSYLGNGLISQQVFVAGNDLVQVCILTTDTNKFFTSINKVVEMDGTLGTALVTKDFNTLTEAKRQAKTMLKSIGVSFNDEVRESKTRLVHELTNETNLIEVLATTK